MKRREASALLSVVVLLMITAAISLFLIRSYQQYASQYRIQIRLNDARMTELWVSRSKK
ncbi:hypothetical protein [Lacticaseibacillus brantae]|uniref:Uncharacterized protein n=1 Tax=Lacticaseibacillus brantae DSM 23927 TaxID=1423727 RepID=A0A0R2B0J5_9LACO|nr:hypothetical protein [Lacticaseibacillus brantae]KRM73053.1 hypothetical protein FC34_GL000774 [Lacticaseibacillus brantae DSM 23927]